MCTRKLGRGLRSVVGIVVAVAFLAGPASPAHAGLLGGLLGTVTGVLGSVTGVLTAGWDDGATTPPVSMKTVADAIGADDLWKNGITGRGVDVAVIDTGVVPVTGLAGTGKVVHGPDLSFDSQTDDLQYLDGYGHGTHMAGIIAGNDEARRGGFRGIAPHARLVNVKVGAADGSVDVTQVIAAIDWVVQHRNDNGMNIRVLNLSYGTDGLQSPLVDPLSHAVEVAWRHGIVVVVGAGNDGTDHPALVNPAYNPYVLAVGAADLNATASVSDDTVAPFSSRGSAARSADLVAPGVSIASLRDPGSTIDQAHPSAVVDNRYFRGSGTSQAAAVTSGAAALLLQARPDLTPDQVKALVKQTATPIVGANLRSQGAGRLNVQMATYAPVPLLAAQKWTASSGTGSIEQSRGASHVAYEGTELRGEQDIFGASWNGGAWAPAATAGTSWNGGTWNGNQWTGTTWSGDDWTGWRWTGWRWTGWRWTGNSWTGDDWTGWRWTGWRWTGDSWNQEGWTGWRWTGWRWTGDAWLSS